MKELFLVIFVVLALLVCLLVLPAAFLWSVNSLFATGIPYTFRHLFAAWVLLFVLRVVTRTEVDHEALRR